MCNFQGLEAMTLPGEYGEVVEVQVILLFTIHMDEKGGVKSTSSYPETILKTF